MSLLWFCLFAPKLILIMSRQQFATGQLIEGHFAKCTNEGEVVDIPLLNAAPCINCRCTNGFVQCSKEECRAQSDECSVLLQMNNRCCKQCKGCLIGGEHRNSAAKWHQRDSSGQCFDHICQDGIVTRSARKCARKCPDDVTSATSRDECGCPTCMGCDQETLSRAEASNPCAKCECLKDGRMSCRNISCPVIACSHERSVFDGCCRKCIGQRQVFELDQGRCWFRRKILENEEVIKVEACVDCRCQNGTVICDREDCPDLDHCPRSNITHMENHCCPTCDVRRDCNTQDGKILKHGQSATSNCVTCQCLNGEMKCGKVECQLKSCPQGEVLEKEPGRCCETCVPEPGICAVFGDPHYRTFDGRPFNFQGSCKYLLTKDCLGRNFSITVENTAKKSKHFAWTNAVHLRIIKQDKTKESNVSLYQHLAVKVNQDHVSLPYVSNDVIMWMEHKIVKVRTTAGISLNWDGTSFLEVVASRHHRGALCGMCGNFNGFPRDDFIGGDGAFKVDKNEFARSWLVGDTKCARSDVTTRSVGSCARPKTKRLAKRKCRIFKSKRFQTCYSKINPADYYRSCLTDSCECPRHKSCSCESIRAYTSACARRGVTITWNERKHCKKSCGKGRSFSTCHTPCKQTCRNYRRVRRSSRCKRKCVAGCFCKPGYVIHNRKCVRVTSCKKKLKRKFKNTLLEHYLILRS